jgi:streptogramin lyase
VPSLPEPITAEQAPVVNVSEREQGRWLITWGPDWLAFGFDSLWVKRDNGTVLRIDPATGDVQAEIQLGPGLCQGIGAGLTVWACSRETSDGPVSLAQIDPSTNTLVATYDVDKSSDQGRLLTVDDRVWVLSGGDRLLGVGTDGTISEPIELGMFCTDLASDGESLWVTCPAPGLVARVDLASGAVTDRIELPRASAADLGEYLWVGFQGGLAQIDTVSLQVLAVYDIPGAASGAVTEAGGSVWVRTAGSPALTRIDPTSQRFVEMIDVLELTSGGDVVVIDDSVWITFFDHQTLLRFSKD